MAPLSPILYLESDLRTPDWEIDVRWDASEGGTGTITYEVYRYNSPINAGNIGSATKVGDTTGLVATVVAPNADTWYIAVVAVDGTGSSDPSNNVSAIIQDFTGPAPSFAVRKDQIGMKFSVDIQWSSVVGAKVYQLYRHTSPMLAAPDFDDAFILGLFDQDVNSYLDEKIPAYGTYYYVIVAIGHAGPSQFAVTKNVSVNFEERYDDRNWYVNKKFVTAYVRMQNPNFTEDRIPDQIMDLAESDINSKLQHFKLNPLNFDLNDPTDNRTKLGASYLRGAMLMQVIVQLSAADIFVFSPGLLSETVVGPTRIEMQRAMPMFFFAKGIEDGFFQLISTKTPEMISFWFVRMFADLFHYTDEDGNYSGVQWSGYQNKYRLPRNEMIMRETEYVSQNALYHYDIYGRKCYV